MAANECHGAVVVVALASVVIPTIPLQRSCRRVRVGIVEANYAQGQFHSFRAL